MFPHDIERVALVAIRHSEWNTVDFLLQELSTWMDNPDPSIQRYAGNIAASLYDSIRAKNAALESKYTVSINNLLKYAFGD